MNKLLTNKIILITGASGGIGSACAQEATKEGATVCLLGRNIEKMSLIIKDLPGEMNGIYETDLESDESIKNIIKLIYDKYGRIDGFIHSAGFEITKPIRKTERKDFINLFNINTVSGIICVKEILKVMKNNSTSTSFILISSIMSILGERGKIAYCASKSSFVSAVKALALEISEKGNRINSVSPGIVETELVSEMFKDFPEDMIERIHDMHPLGIGKPEDISGLCCFLLSDKARWITGSNVIIDGGYSAR